MKNTAKYKSRYAYRFMTVFMFALLLTSCDNVITETSEQSESIHTEKITALNNLFLESNIDIRVRDIKPASREEIRKIRRFAQDNLTDNRERRYLSANQIKWDQTEILTIDDHDMVVSITEVNNSYENGRKILYSLMNDETVLYQVFKHVPNNDIDLATGLSLSDGNLLDVRLVNLNGFCLSETKTHRSKMASYDPSFTANSTDEACFEGCVTETITEGSAAFTLFCIATGPYCAAAILIACASKCAIQ